jgi:hypothetical protein
LSRYSTNCVTQSCQPASITLLGPVMAPSRRPAVCTACPLRDRSDHQTLSSSLRMLTPAVLVAGRNPALFRAANGVPGVAGLTPPNCCTGEILSVPAKAEMTGSGGVDRSAAGTPAAFPPLHLSPTRVRGAGRRSRLQCHSRTGGTLARVAGDPRLRGDDGGPYRCPGRAAARRGAVQTRDLAEC